jgi:CHAT domain-containing protein
MARLMRYILSRQHDDLKGSILGFTEAIHLPHPCYPHLMCLNVAEIFFYLTIAIFYRAEQSRLPEDVKYCIMYLRYLRGQWHEVPIHAPFTVAGTLLSALAVHVELQPENVDQDIEEMVGLCMEILNSDISTDTLIHLVMALVRAVRVHLREPSDGKVPSEKVIGCLRKAIDHLPLPHLHEVSLALVRCLLKRFLATALKDDYEEGMAILDKVIMFRPLGDSLRLYQSTSMRLATTFSLARFGMDWKPEDLEKAIHRHRIWLDRMPVDDPDRSMIMECLSHLQGLRFGNFRVTADSEAALSSTFEPDILHPSFRDLAASLSELDPAKPFSWETFSDHADALDVTAIKRLTDITDIKDGIKYCRELLASYPNATLSLNAREALGHLFYRAFELANDIEYLNKAISAARDNINGTGRQMRHGSSLLELIKFLSHRLDMFGRREDLNELMQLFAAATDHGTGLLNQSPVSCRWALIARHFGHPSVSTAYDRAMSSMRRSLTFAPTLDTQHSGLVALSVDFKTLPLDYASYQIHTGRLVQAIETLEQGRALLWSEMRRLRTSIDQIRLADSQLAGKFAAVNGDLERITFAFSPDNSVGTGVSFGQDGDLEQMDPFGHLVVRQRKLLDDREEFISQIQALPGFDNFLKPPPFDTLHSAASHGPVIIINHSRWRSDIVIILHHRPPSLIPTPDDFYSRANKLQHLLLEERKKGLESDKYEDALRSVLKELYDLVGRPVIKRLNELNVPEQSRVWWCPTSALCSLPLHAMGPIPSHAGPPKYFLDLYVPSYTPSLSALIESRKPGSQAIDKPSILLVAQPDEKMPQALKEMQAVRAIETQVTTLFSAKATPSAVLARLRDHPFAHIVCHGILEPGRPFEASFKLHRGKRLPLLDIVRSQLPDAEFAFLSACHTAELTDESVADEMLHLAAAMQFCGFRSVVGTMWAMADVDGRDLASHFYESVFSEETNGTTCYYYERTAVALRDAVKYLRRKGGGVSLERWVNFVHYGA